MDDETIEESKIKPDVCDFNLRDDFCVSIFLFSILNPSIRRLDRSIMYRSKVSFTRLS